MLFLVIVSMESLRKSKNNDHTCLFQEKKQGNERFKTFST